MKRNKFLFLFWLLITPVFAQKVKEIDGIRYLVISQTEVGVINNNSNEYIRDIVIPERVKIRGKIYKVTQIRDNAFSNCKGLLSVRIPNSITSIGNGAFAHCYALTSINIPNSVTSIGDYAFANCYTLVNVTLSNRITNIGKETFRYCESLYSIIIPVGVLNIGNRAFIGCKSLNSATIPNSVVNIGKYAFANCRFLKDVIVPDVTNAEDSVFYNSPNLEHITGYSEEMPQWLIPQLAISGSSLTNRFYTLYANERIKDRFLKWQEKGEFETINQWKQRIEEKKRLEQFNKIELQVREEFIKNNKPASLRFAPGKYDADKQILPISVVDFDTTVYIQIGVEAAYNLKTSWRNVSITPIYGIKNDQLAVVGVTASFDGCEYKSLDNYIQIDNSN